MNPDEEKQEYSAKTKRIGLDIPITLRDELHSVIPSGMMSGVIRELLSELLVLTQEKGPKLVMLAILNNGLTVSLKKVISDEN